MTEQNLEIRLLHLKDAHILSPLLATYAQALKRGAPRRPDDFYAEQLLQDRTAQVIGAHIDGKLVAFTIFYDLPDPVSGLRAGQVDHIHVQHNWQGKGIAKAMIDTLCDKAEENGWQRLMLHAPRLPEDGKRLYQQIAAPAEWTNFVIEFA